MNLSLLHGVAGFSSRAALGIALTSAALSTAACSSERLSSAEGDAPEIASVGPRFGGEDEEGGDHQSLRARTYFGGNGGQWEYVRCPTIVGFQGRSGEYVDALGFMCEQSIAVTFPTAMFGGGGGRPFNDGCPSGFVATGIYGASGRHIDRLGLFCRNGNDELATTNRYGGGGGGEFRWECPSGQKLIGANLKAGALNDGIEPVCGWR